MRKNVVEVISAMGALLSIVTNLVKFIQELGGDVGSSIYRLAQPEGENTLRQIAKLIVEAGRPASDMLTLVVDYGMSVADAIVAGKYDWVNSDITAEHFPSTQTGKQIVRGKLYHFNRSSTSEQAITEMDRDGMHPATLPELLAFDAAHPELQRQFPIVALGSVLPNGCVPVLGARKSGRSLDLEDAYWNQCCGFLAISKETSGVAKTT